MQSIQEKVTLECESITYRVMSRLTMVPTTIPRMVKQIDRWFKTKCQMPPIRSYLVGLRCSRNKLDRMKAMITKQRLTTNCRAKSLALKERFLVSMVRAATKYISRKARSAARAGLTNHEITIVSILLQLRASKLVATAPAPRRAPITVCVPEMGIPEKDEVMINRKDEKQTETIISCCSLIGSYGRSLMMSLLRVSATLSEQNIAPTNSATAPRMISLLSESAFDP